MRHIILGAGGAIGKALTDVLVKNKEEVTLFSRSGFKDIRCETEKGDLNNLDDVIRATQGINTAFLTAGLEYNSDIWGMQWPEIMKNCITACEQNDVKLIYFDNVYVYGKVTGEMTEETEMYPCSIKGRVKKATAEILLEAIAKGRIKGIIARSADLYGPYATEASYPYKLVINRLIERKTPQWRINSNIKHSFTYTKDCGEALYILSKDESAYNQIWHLPTFSPAITGNEFIKKACDILGQDFSVELITKEKMINYEKNDKTGKELAEILYQYEEPYLFNSDKFCNKYKYSPTSYSEGITEIISFFLRNK